MRVSTPASGLNGLKTAAMTPSEDSSAISEIDVLLGWT